MVSVRDSAYDAADDILNSAFFYCKIGLVDAALESDCTIHLASRGTHEPTENNGL